MTLQTSEIWQASIFQNILCSLTRDARSALQELLHKLKRSEDLRIGEGKEAHDCRLTVVELLHDAIVGILFLAVVTLIKYDEAKYLQSAADPASLLKNCAAIHCPCNALLTGVLQQLVSIKSAYRHTTMKKWFKMFHLDESPPEKV